MESVTIRVPATTANLGPGFDCLGCALTLYNDFSFQKSATLRFRSCEEAYCNESNLAYVAYAATLKRAGVTPAPGVTISFLKAEIPISRGLGSSAALIVAGALAANALFDLGLSRETLLAVCTEIEGHPDNLSPALLGGLTASVMTDGCPVSVSYPVNPSLRFVALIPDFPLSTHAARSVLPSEVPFRDATFNLSHTALVPAAFATADETLLRLALTDRLHQPYRKALIPGYDEVERLAWQEGCLAFCLSGAGPTCLCLTTRAAFANALLHSLQNEGLSHWSVRELSVCHDGAHQI